LYDNKKAILIFYIVVLSVLALMFLLTTATIDDEFHGRIEGLEFASAIFLFVVGLNSFKEVFRMFIQNGISRKNMFISHIISTLAICGAMTLIDSVIALLFKGITSISGGSRTEGMLQMMYGQQIASVGTFLASIFLTFFIYIMFFAFGFFLTTLYYRMSKSMKIIVSVGVPALLMVVLPILDAVLFRNFIFTVTAKITGAAFINPYICMLSNFILFGVLTVLSWLLVKKAVVKD
ncbi:MAG: hypothetical protein PHC69_12750, partial [Ruminiclostridium sp.]|nr:hypothetical protein [Ruminiclostridium sp.]